jgi:hypothetical protein
LRTSGSFSSLKVDAEPVFVPLPNITMAARRIILISRSPKPARCFQVDQSAARLQTNPGSEVVCRASALTTAAFSVAPKASASTCLSPAPSL